MNDLINIQSYKESIFEDILYINNFYRFGKKLSDIDIFQLTCVLLTRHSHKELSVVDCIYLDNMCNGEDVDSHIILWNKYNEYRGYFAKLLKLTPDFISNNVGYYYGVDYSSISPKKDELIKKYPEEESNIRCYLGSMKLIEEQQWFPTQVRARNKLHVLKH